MDEINVGGQGASKSWVTLKTHVGGAQTLPSGSRILSASLTVPRSHCA
jgi:hypothetical protein